MFTKKSAAEAVLNEFPNASSKSAGKIAYERNPALFKDAESARSSVRRARGAYGLEGRERKRYTTSPPSPFTTKAFDDFPEGQTYVQKWEPLQVAGPRKVLVMADLHIPFHDKAGVLTAIRYGKEHGADTVLLNGDIADFFSVSFWQTDPNRRNLRAELDTVREFIRSLRKEFPKARIIYKVGNHEERWKRFVISKAPEIYGMDEIEIGPLLRLGEHRVELVDEKRPVRLGQLNVLHGHEYSFAISNPVNPARGLFLRCKAHAITSHFHQVSHHSEKTVEGGSIATWSTGCLCDINPEYRPLNNWSHGFAFVKVDADGKFHVDNKVLKSGKLY